MIERTPYPRMAAALIGLLGLIDAVYLSISHMYPGSLVCPTGGGCETVQSSIYSIFPPGSEQHIAVAYLGVAGYSSIVILALISLYSDRIGRLSVPALLLTFSSLGVIFAIYLMSVQLFILKTPDGAAAICFWCVLSALAQLLIWIALLLDWRARKGGEQRQVPAVAHTAHPY